MAAIISPCTRVISRAQTERMTPFYGRGKTNAGGDVGPRMVRRSQAWGGQEEETTTATLFQAQQQLSRRGEVVLRRRAHLHANAHQFFMAPPQRAPPQPEGANATLICVLKLLS